VTWRRTNYRNAEYASPLTLWRTVVERHPHGRARAALGVEVGAAGRIDDAISELRRAVPDFPDARFLLGFELYVGGHLEEASTELRGFIAAQPSRTDRPDAVYVLNRQRHRLDR
jgi:hypothetical protein